MGTANKGVNPKVARATPSLKLQTHLEEKKTEMSMAQVLEMWKSLYSMNKWKPQEDEKKIKKTLRRTT